MARKAQNPVKSTQRSFDIIEILHELDGARLTDVSAKLDLPDSTVHNHLSTLVERGYVVKQDNTYHVSLRFLELGQYARARRMIYEISRHELLEIAEKTNEVAILMVEEHGFGAVLDVQRGDEAIPLDIVPGKHVHLHASALGKCILAYLPNDRIEAIIDRHHLPAVTEHTITDRDDLFDQLEFIRNHDIAFEDEERVLGTRSVATSIKGSTGGIIGAIGVIGPTTRMPQDRLNESIPAFLSNAANIIELKLEHS